MWCCCNHSPSLLGRLSAHRVLPDLLTDDEAAHATLVSVVFGDVTSRHGWGQPVVSPGCVMTVGEVSKRPTEMIWLHRLGEWHAVVMVDMDYPVRSSHRRHHNQYRHWLVVNVPNCSINDGQELTEYKGPTPGVGTGYHRVVVLVYSQPRMVQYCAVLPDERRCWSLDRFVQSLDLSLVAVNFFIVKYSPPEPA